MANKKTHKKLIRFLIDRCEIRKDDTDAMSDKMHALYSDIMSEPDDDFDDDEEVYYTNPEDDDIVDPLHWGG